MSNGIVGTNGGERKPRLPVRAAVGGTVRTGAIGVGRRVRRGVDRESLDDAPGLQPREIQK